MKQRLSINDVNELLLAEKKTAALAKLSTDIYYVINQTIKHLEHKREEMDKENKTLAFDIYHEELRKMKKLQRQIIAIREQKIVKLALTTVGKKLKANTNPFNLMTHMERAFFHALRELIASWETTRTTGEIFDPPQVVILADTGGTTS